MIAAAKRRFFPVSPVLPGYRQPKNAWWIKLRNGLFLSILIFVGMLYGAIVAIFPLFFYIWLALPLGLLVGLVIWTLPEAKSFPEAANRANAVRLPRHLVPMANYLALTLPGLPWITLNPADHLSAGHHLRHQPVDLPPGCAANSRRCSTPTGR